jgi:hypothetical protein
MGAFLHFLMSWSDDTSPPPADVDQAHGVEPLPIDELNGAPPALRTARSRYLLTAPPPRRRY